MPISGQTNNTASQAYNTQSSDSSTQLSGFTSRILSTPSPESNQKRKKRMSDVILLCIGLGSGEKVRNLPSQSNNISYVLCYHRYPDTGYEKTLNHVERKLKQNFSYLRETYMHLQVLLWQNTSLSSLNKKTSLEVISGNVRFTWDEILRATGWFATDLIVREGGSSTVYRGKLDNGEDVAVKRAKKINLITNARNADDEHLTDESFRTEIATLQQISHINLVGFYGYLLFEDEMIIVLEWVPNGNLRQHLDGQYGKVLEFANRLDIIIDITHAITYLRTYCDVPLIHRDIKSSNILLTSTLHGKIADFGLAMLSSIDAGNAVFQSMVKGAHGYVDPEYFKTNQVTDKSDVYSYGVVLVEVIIEKCPTERISDHSRVDWVMNEFLKGNTSSTIDPSLATNPAITVVAERIYDLAYRCLNSDRRRRPSMDECGRILWNIRKHILTWF